MSIGTSVPLPAYTVDSALMAQKAEELGFESIWYAEHPILPVHSASPFPSTPRQAAFIFLKPAEQFPVNCGNFFSRKMKVH